MNSVLECPGARFDGDCLIVPKKTADETLEAPFPLRYPQLAGLVTHWKNFVVSAGVVAGDVVACVVPNRLEFVVSFFSIVGARAIIAPLNPAFKKEELLYYLRDLNAKAVIVSTGQHAAESAAADLHLSLWHIDIDPNHVLPEQAPTPELSRIRPLPGDIALMLHTSGTTGRPKGP